MVLMDMAMPELNGLEATLQIKEFDKDIKVLIMTMYDDEEVVMRCLAAGASGYAGRRPKGAVPQLRARR